MDIQSYDGPGGVLVVVTKLLLLMVHGENEREDCSGSYIRDSEQNHEHTTEKLGFLVSRGFGLLQMYSTSDAADLYAVNEPVLEYLLILVLKSGTSRSNNGTGHGHLIGLS